MHLGYLQSIKHYKCAAIHSGASSDLSLIIVSYFFSHQFSIFLGAPLTLSFIGEQVLILKTLFQKHFQVKGDLNQQTSGYQEEDLV